MFMTCRPITTPACCSTEWTNTDAYTAREPTSLPHRIRTQITLNNTNHDFYTFPVRTQQITLNGYSFCSASALLRITVLCSANVDRKFVTRRTAVFPWYHKYYNSGNAECQTGRLCGGEKERERVRKGVSEADATWQGHMNHMHHMEVQAAMPVSPSPNAILAKDVHVLTRFWRHVENVIRRLISVLRI